MLQIINAILFAIVIILASKVDRVVSNLIANLLWPKKASPEDGSTAPARLTIAAGHYEGEGISDLRVPDDASEPIELVVDGGAYDLDPDGAKTDLNAGRMSGVIRCRTNQNIVGTFCFAPDPGEPNRPLLTYVITDQPPRSTKLYRTT